MEKKIDVLLATYNGEKYVAEQIESILNQTYKNFNLIISDDYSKDGTQQILKEYAKKDNRIKLFFQKQNLGIVKNIEFLLKQVESSLYMLSDQDDFWMTEKIEKSVEKLVQENADLVFGDLEIVDEKLKTIYPSFAKYNKLDMKIKKNINNYKLNYLYNCVTGCTILSKKEFIKEILPIPTNSKHIIHDHWIGLILSLKGKVAYMQEPYIKYRQHGDNQVGTKKVSYGFEKFDEVRNHFIDVKLGIFETYVEHNRIFPKDIQNLNIKALEYYKMLKLKNKANFRGWNIYRKLYKTESFTYYMLNFVILNLPGIGRILFKIKK